VLPNVVPIEREVARSAEAVVAVSSIAVYPNGFEFTLFAVLRVARRGGPGAHAGHWLEPDQPPPAKFLRVGVQFSDGRRVTNLNRLPAATDDAPDATPQPKMMGGGGGGRRQFEGTYYVWPLPPSGTLSVVCEWPAYGIDESRIEVDAQTLIDASARSIQLWPDDDDQDDSPVPSNQPLSDDDEPGTGPVSFAHRIA
jgi:hypothetical protein